MKISCIVTVLNEEKTGELLLNALRGQTRIPDEIVIVDGGSTDMTVSVFSTLTSGIKSDELSVRIEEKHGNRSVGRNEAIRLATGDIIVCTDAGCIPDKHWVERITKPFEDPSIDVVAGYYESRAETVFQECLVPYVFVMPDKLKPGKFLPASRSMAFRRAVWEKAGGFPEQYSHNEDYVFARTLKSMGMKIHFQKDAFVYWIPRKTFHEAFTMFYRFAFGDMEAGIYRPKVLLLFVRYLFGIALLTAAIVFKSVWLIALCVSLFAGYIAWSIMKSYRYVDDEQAYILLPAIQFTADAAVITGSVGGFFHRLWGTKKTS